MAAGTPLAKNNAFGVGSPSWNLPFPGGNVTDITAVEILTYLPHWLKSIDVINRFVSHGARSGNLASIINEFRYQPTGQNFQPNSVQIMMSYAMRQAGFKGWTVGAHKAFGGEVDEASLNVKGFRPPYITHPRKPLPTHSSNGNLLNVEAPPIAFKDLALHVKKHPSGSDALDLSRCVQYALKHLHEDWVFPTDFERLVIHLGGQTAVTSSHYDKNVFRRRDKDFSSGKAAAKTITRAINHMFEPLPTNMRQLRYKQERLISRSSTPEAITVKQQSTDEQGLTVVGNKRRSGRLLGKVINLREEDSDTTLDKDLFDSTYSGNSTPRKKRRTLSTNEKIKSPSNDSDFVQEDSESDEEIPDPDDPWDEEDFESPSRERLNRAAAQKARVNIKTSLSFHRTSSIVNVPNIESSSDDILQDSSTMLKYNQISSADAARAANIHATRQPKFVKPPALSRDRLRVDSSSIYLYADEGCTTMEERWASALSSTRFHGPRRSAPYRELHRLTNPPASDASDWAENIRWAKEQHRIFGSETWTEYDYHLELITTERRETMWVSEEAILAGMRKAVRL